MTKAEIEEINDRLQVENMRLKRQLETANDLLQREMNSQAESNERVIILERQLELLSAWVKKLSGTIEKIAA